MIDATHHTRVALLAVILGAGGTLSPAQAGEKPLVDWRFDRDADVRAWHTSGQIADLAARGGALCGRATGHDPYLVGPVFAVPAGPLQHVEIRLKATSVAQAELFWTETLQGRFGGFSEAKVERFRTLGDGQFHTYRIYPFWHAAGKILRLRFDPPSAGEFAIEWIRIVEQAPLAAADKGKKSWTADEFRSTWQAVEMTGQGSSPVWLSPPVSLPAGEYAFVCVRLATDCQGDARLFCASRSQFGWDSASVPLRPDQNLHSYNIDVGALKHWQGEVILLGLQLPGGASAGTRVESIEVAREPRGPAELEVSYFGPSEGVNRAGCPAGVTCTVRNLGGEPAEQATAVLEAPPGVRIVGEARQTIDRISLDLARTASWQVQSDRLGRIALAVKVGAPGRTTVSAAAAIDFTARPDVPRSKYVPEPRPVPSPYEVGVYYFPGWNSAARWQPIRDYPRRKPILGWYDEANPECADWQIKWAVEHGITFFMVDWYWCQGRRHLEHWVEQAYAQARWRKYLKWAVMWANHNPPHTHSLDDWRAVTRYWIDHCFNMPEYYRIDGRPAVFIWAPAGVRRDLGGGAQAAELYALSQKMAREAGLPGIYFVAMSSHESPALCRDIKAEGYEAMTSYHGFQPARQRAASDHFPYSGILDTSPALWREEDERATEAGLRYLPVVDTGWDSQPWHGSRAMVAQDRTPELFGGLCRLARQYADQAGKKIIAVGPWNEWGEGSYIEPYAEHGFEDLDQLRAAFCAPGDWPPNLIPADVGLGPYDLPPLVPKTAWEFNTDGDLEGWVPNGDVADLQVKGGFLAGRSTGHDPLLETPGIQVEARRLPRLVFRMRSDKDDHVQIFWGTTLSRLSGLNMLEVPIVGDGQFHDYEVDLRKNCNWRGVVTALRLDPATKPGVSFALDFIRLREDL